MKIIGTNKDGFTQYELSLDECKEMLNRAKDALKYTYPEKNKGYAACVLTANGNMYTGASYTSDVHNITMHGEAVTYAVAAQSGEAQIVAITGPNCHLCKQLIWESAIRSKIDTVVIIEDGTEIKQVPISELMLYPWPDAQGNK